MYKESKRNPSWNGVDMEATTAIAIARRALQIPEGVPVEAVRVRLLEGPAQAYFLIAFRSTENTTLACVSDDSGELQSSVRSAKDVSALTVPAERARGLAALGPNARLELVWKPCRASLSMLYPIWEVSEGVRAVYVDQQGVVWKELEPKRPGG